MKETHQLMQAAEVEITYKSNIKPENRPVITCSRDAQLVFYQMWSTQMEFLEEFNILALNNSNQVIAFVNISKGGTSATIVDTKVVYATALKLNASKIVLAHNHPSGRLRPSNADIELTTKIVQAGKILGIPVLDHLIVTTDGYYSFADEGQL